ncbi:MAG: flagellar basal body P-ring formation chaperone FlgA [bacterium]|nr:flagellar basal body P-ring formation chaperone FlgA [bacterium]
MRPFVLIMVFVLATGGWCAQQPRIELRDLSIVRSARFTLGEVATIAGADAHTQARLAAVVLGTSPLPGAERTITLEQVATRMRQHGFRPESFDIIAPTKIVVRREVHLFRAQRAIEAAIGKLREAACLSDDAQAVCDTPPRDLPLPGDKVDLVAGEPRALGAGLYVVPVQIACDGTSPVTLNVRLRVSRWREALVARRTIRTGEAIEADAVVVQRIASNTEETDLLTDASEAIGKIARRPIAAGQPLKRSAIDDPAVVRRGQNVKLLVRLDGAVIETGAIALQDGKAGARIRVQVSDTRKTLLATVLDGETVTVDVR